MRRIYRNTKAQGCGDCPELVQPFAGRLYLYDAHNPPPPGTRSVHRSWLKVKGKRRRVPVIYVVRSETCAQIRDAAEAADRLAETHPEGPWWAA